MARIVLLASLASAAAAAEVRPHVLYILLDDWGWADAGWHRAPGEEDGVSTPNLDALLAEGVELTRHYSYKLCSPSRTAIQSGRNPIHASVVNTKETFHNPKDPVAGYSAMPMNMTGMGELMVRGGYTTHFYGKWDAGMATPLHSPLGRGYQKSLFYFHHQNDYWTSSTQPAESDAGDTTCPGFPKERGPRDLWEDDHPATHLVNSVNCSQSMQHGCTYEDQIFTDRVVSAIEEHDTASPLFVFWAPHAVHDPLEVPQAYADRLAKWGPPSGRWERQYYLAILSYIDEQIGKVVTLLKQRGMWDNTFVIVHADNGGPIYQGGKAGGNNWPLKGGKVSNWEGGIRVNALVSGGFLPDKVRGTRSSGLMAAWDWYATLAGLAGVDSEDRRAATARLPPHDSVNLWPLLSGATEVSPRLELPVGTDGLLGIGRGFEAKVGALIKGKYKLIVESVMTMSGWTGPIFPNLTRWDADYAIEYCGAFPAEGCLFDIEADPSETNNLARRLPEVWHELNEARLAHEKTCFSPDRGSVDLEGACAQVERNGGFWGPWLHLDAWPEAHERSRPLSPSAVVI